MRLSYTSILLCVAWYLSAFPLAAADRPNILFLFADDQRADTIAAYGNPHIRTPNLDDLAARGFSFRQNYCFGSNSGAVCVPSRAMLMTGKYWLHTNERMDGELILPELLRQNGYTTFAAGKWHNQPPALLRGFERGTAIYLGGMCDHTEVFVQDIAGGRLVNRRIGEKFSSELFADAAIDFLESYQDEKPFFAYVSFTAPHDPRQPPVKYRQMYYENRPPLPKNFLPQHPFDNGHMRGGRDENLAAWPRTEAVVRDQLAEYYGLITHLDEQIGRILRALEASGLQKNTIIIYAADHGLAIGSHGLLGKQSVYEHSMKCPLIFVGPDVPANASTQAFTYLLDIYPTVCSILGIDPPTGLDGHDLSAIWQGHADHVRDSIFLPFQDVQRAVRDQRWKLICYPQINYRQLFDLVADPDELHNLADSTEYAPQVERMLALMKQWQEQVGDHQPLTVKNPKRKEVDLTGRPRVPDRWQPKWIRDKYFDGAEPSASDKAAQDALRRKYAGR